MIDKDLSLAIKNLRIPLALLIVFGHSDILHFPIYSGVEPTFWDSSLVSYPITYLCRILFAPANALFFMISGILFFGLSDYFNWSTYKKKMQKRLKTLLIPYLIWQLIYLCKIISYNTLRGGGGNILFYIQSLWCVPNTTCPADPPLWFLRDLMVCMALSPILYRIIRRWWASLIFYGVLFVDWLLGTEILPQFPGLSLMSILFFSLGAAIGIWKVDYSLLKTKVDYVIILFILLSIADLFSTHYQMNSDFSVNVICNTIMNNTLIIVACFAYIILVIKYQSFFCKFDIGGSFVIYASHWIILELFNIIITKVCPSEINVAVASIIFICRVTIAFGGGYLINKIIMKNVIVTRMLAGGRS